MLSIVLFAWPSSASARPAEKPPSVILISVDTLRADRLSCYGYRRVRTPHLDALASGGTLFTSIESPVPLTFPSHTSLFTSTYPFSHGVEDNGEALSPQAVTLATVLKAHGYRTGAVVGGFVLDRRFGLNRGFDDYDSTFDLHREKSTDPGDIKRLGQDVIASSIEWLKKNSGLPFFLFVHLYDLHTPYNLPAAYRARYGSGYDAELQYVDAQVGALLEFLRQAGLFEKSLVVLTSDHGEGLGEHGEKNHGYFVYESTLHVPLLMHWPIGSGGFPARSSSPASLMDVAPTILQFAGISSPPEFQGRSLLQFLREGASASNREVYSESLYAHNHFGCSPLRSLRLGRYKYIRAPKSELYDLDTDPDETRNLYTQQRSLALASDERLSALLARYRGTQGQSGKALDADTVARLSSLGYVAVSRQHAATQDTGDDPKDRINDFEDFGRAILLAATGQVAESNTKLDHLLAEHPDLLDVRMTRGLNDQRLGQHADAAREFQQVLKADPLNIQAHFDLGLSLFELHRWDESAKELQAALALAPYYTRAEELLATVWLRKGDYRRAHDQFEHVLTIDPNDYSAHYNLGALAVLSDHWETGEQHLKTVLRMDPTDADAHNTLGSLYLRKGDFEKAGSQFQEVIRLRPEFVGAHYNLGLAFDKRGRKDEAAAEYRRALAIDPNFRPASDALARLGKE